MIYESPYNRTTLLVGAYVVFIWPEAYMSWGIKVKILEWEDESQQITDY